MRCRSLVIALCLVGLGIGGGPMAQHSPAAQEGAAASASNATIRLWMRRTVEVGSDPSVHFRHVGGKAVTSDGARGTLTAAIGVRHITADGKGQLVFFFRGGKFLGWDSKYEIASIKDVKNAGEGRFDVTYIRYAASDPLCCPSLSPKTVRYRWNGSRLKPLAKRPRDPWTPVAVRLAR
jgi:hypothetical protein